MQHEGLDCFCGSGSVRPFLLSVPLLEVPLTRCFIGGATKPGDERPAPEVWNVYDGAVIPLQEGDILHVNAMRIGYTPTLIDYVDGKVMAPEKP